MMARFTKVVFAAALVCALCLPAVAAQSATDLTSQNEKLAFLYGASNIIAIEQLIAQQQGTQASPFVTAWIKAFGNTNWTDIQKKLDAWYAAHPDQANREVFDVLWYEFMVPASK